MDKNLTVSDVISGTIATFTENLQPMGLFIGVFTLVGFAIEYSMTDYMLTAISAGSPALETFQALAGFGAGLGGLVIFIASVIAQYLLWEAVLRNEIAGAQVARHRYLAYFGLSLLSSIGVAFGMLLLVVPGLILMARWAMAPAILIGENRGVFDSLGASWDSTRGNTTPVALAILAAGIAFIVLSMVIGGATVVTATSPMQPGAVPIFLGHLVQNAGSALAIALGVFLYKQLRGTAAQVSEVFA